MNKIYGLIGEKLSHSYSVEIHESIMKELQINADYRLFELQNKELASFIKSPLVNLHGTNVTIPYKIQIMNYLDELSVEAKKIGSVNTILFKKDKTMGYNTDYFGFSMMLKHFNIDVTDKNIIVLGTGGASKAIIQYLKDFKSKSITLVTRQISQPLNNDLKLITYEDLASTEKDVIINTTPNGMYPQVDSSPVTLDQIKGIEAAVDIIYNPETTKFMKLANEAGAKSVSGLYMLVAQAVKAQEIWQDIKIDDSITLKVFNEISRHFK